MRKAVSRITYTLVLTLLLSCQPTEQEKDEITSNLVDQGCEIPPSFDGYTCKGRFVASNEEELTTYLSNYGLKNGFVKHLKIDFDYVTESVQITSPCSITVRDNASLTSTTGSSCLVAKGAVKARGMNFSALNGNTTFASYEGNVIIDDGSTINTKNLNMMGQHKCVIQNTANITAHDINMKSFGTGDDARVHIRHSSTVTANNIFLEAKRKATLGRDSIYNVSGTVSIIGEGPDDDADNPEFATIWKGTTVNASELIINSLSKTKVSGGITVNANRVELNGPACHIGKTAVFNAPLKEGNCFSGDHPTANFRLPKAQRSGEAPYTVNLDASRSTDNDAIVSYEWKLGNIETITSTESTSSYTFTEPGVYKVRLKVTDTSGLIDYRSRKITVTGEENTDVEAYFKYAFNDEGGLETYFFGRSENQITEARYSIVGGSLEKELAHFDINTKTSFDELAPGTYQIKLDVEDEFGNSDSFTHDIDFNSNQMIPIVNFDTDMSAENTIFLSALKSFFPGNILFYDFDFEIEINWGDGSSDTVTDLYKTHTYGSPGPYLVKVTLKDDEGNFASHEELIDVEASAGEILKPVAYFDFGYEEFAQNAVFTASFSGSPNGDIESYIWDFGDGTMGFGEEATHIYDVGVYKVKLSVVDSAGESASETMRIPVVGFDTSFFITEFPCEIDEDNYKSYYCSGGGADKLNQLTGFSIDWGDGSPIESQDSFDGFWGPFDFYHDYAEDGSYTVTIKAITFRGDEETYTEVVNVQEDLTPDNIAPVADLNCFSPGGFTVSCDASGSFDEDGFITNYTFSYSEGEQNGLGSSFEHTFSEGGMKSILLNVMDNEGAESSLQGFVFLEEEVNEAPVALLTCNRTGLYTVSCDGSGSSDDQGITDYIFSFEGQQQNGSSSSVDITFSSFGSKRVELEVSDESELRDHTSITLDLNDTRSPPVAVLMCSTNFLEVSCSASNSFDSDGNIISYSFDMGDGAVLSEEVISHAYSEGGPKLISLIIVDNDGLSDTKEVTVTAQENQAPVADFDCSADQVVALRANCESNSYDPDGGELSYEWRKSGEIVGTTQNLVIDFDLITERIELRVVDLYGGISTIYKDINPRVPDLGANISCEQYDNFKGSCVANINIEKGLYDSYEWFVDGVSKGGAETLLLDYQEESDLVVKLVVNAFGGQLIEDFSIPFSLAQIPLENLPSKGKASLAEGVNSPFYNIDEEITINFVDATVGFKEDGEPLEFSLGEVSRYTDYEVFEDKVVIRGGFENGKNTINLTFIDELGKKLSEKISFIAGDKDVSIEFNGSPDTLKNVDVYLISEKEKIHSFEINLDNFIIRNLPSLDSVLLSKTGDFSKMNLLQKDEISLEVVFGNIVEPVNLDNHDFSYGYSGWSVLKGEAEEVNKIYGNLYQESEGSSLKLSPDPNGYIHIRSLIGSRSSETGFLELPFRFIGIDKRDYSIFRVRNVVTGESSINIYTPDNLDSGTGNVSNFLMSFSLGEVDESQNLEIEMIGKFHETQPLTTGIKYLDNFFNNLFPKAVASGNLGSNSLTFKGIKKSQVLLSGFDLKDGQGHGVGDSLKSIIERPFPTLYGNQVLLGGDSINVYDITARYNLKSKLGEDVQVHLFLCGEDHVGSPETCVGTKVSNSQIKNVRFNESVLSFYDNKVKPCLLAFDSTLNIVGHKCLPRTLIVKKSLSGTGKVGGRASNLFEGSSWTYETRYGARAPKDNKDGGDDWVAKSHFNLASSIVSFKGSYGGVIHNIKIDDASASGVSNNGFEHEEHNDGLSLDLRFEHSSELGDLTSLRRGRDGRLVESIWDASNIGNLLNSISGKHSRLLINYDESDYGSDFSSYSKTTILNNCSKLIDNITLDNKHGDHFHLEMKKTVNGSIPTSDYCPDSISIDNVTLSKVAEKNEYTVEGLPQGIDKLELAVVDQDRSVEGIDLYVDLTTPKSEEFSFSGQGEGLKIVFHPSKIFKFGEALEDKNFNFKLLAGVDAGDKMSWSETAVSFSVIPENVEVEAVEPLVIDRTELNQYLTFSTELDFSKIVLPFSEKSDTPIAITAGDIVSVEWVGGSYSGQGNSFTWSSYNAPSAKAVITDWWGREITYRQGVVIRDIFSMPNTENVVACDEVEGTPFTKFSLIKNITGGNYSRSDFLGCGYSGTICQDISISVEGAPLESNWMNSIWIKVIDFDGKVTKKQLCENPNGGYN